MNTTPTPSTPTLDNWKTILANAMDEVMQGKPGTIKNIGFCKISKLPDNRIKLEWAGGETQVYSLAKTAWAEKAQ